MKAGLKVSLLLMTMVTIGCGAAIQETPNGWTKADGEFNGNEGNSVPSMLPLTLIGTVTRSTGETSLAMVRVNETGQIRYYGANQLLEGKWRITRVTRGQLYFSRNGNEEYLEIATSEPAAVPDYEEDAFEKAPQEESEADREENQPRVLGELVTRTSVSREEVEPFVLNTPELERQLTMVPNEVEGSIIGMKVSDLDYASAFAKIGIQKDDVLYGVNGIEIISLSQTLSQLQNASNRGKITVDLSRQGTRRKLVIEIL
ncbi:MAG TPA: hypothetical protein VI895_09065 [Bdellovibrionota bacterium]|nr:hypothetical protein [Bdellovibrionota bacterium]